MGELPGTLNQAVMEVAYRARVNEQWPRGFEVPAATLGAWKHRDFTKSYLRSFLTFCARTRIDDWVKHIEHSLEKERDPWKKHKEGAESLRNCLKEWAGNGGGWVAQQWSESSKDLFSEAPPPVDSGFRNAETLRLARDEMARCIRAAIRAKGRGR